MKRLKPAVVGVQNANAAEPRPLTMVPETAIWSAPATDDRAAIVTRSRRQLAGSETGPGQAWRLVTPSLGHRLSIVR